MSSVLDTVCVDQSGALVTCAHAAPAAGVNPAIFLVVGLVAGLTCAIACATLASRKNRSVVVACLLGLAFGVFSVVGYALVRERPAFA